MLAFDELFLLNELIHKYIISYYLFFGWIIPGIFFFICLGYLFIKLIKLFPILLRWKIGKAGIVYLTGVMGFEMISIINSNYFGNIFVIKKIIDSTEELIEYFGVVLLLIAFFSVLKGLIIENQKVNL